MTISFQHDIGGDASPLQRICEKDTLPSSFLHVLPRNPQIVYWIFMNSKAIGASLVSCVSGNKNNLSWILLCLLPKYLGTPFAYANFLLIQAVDRSPSAVGVLGNFGVINL
ncbi:hypothetical protein L6164_002505 [Bauhinia variegata]|uniref:Uncharacterized protein n=1 Tax=Bauhinia variegata TaxID=167791 RepID=A0ACB9Q141_BAUVA|nr:hypothetical protein L6164_002505 [Bauhinia variegata]